VFAYGPDPQAAKDFLRWIMDPKQYRPWISSGDMYFAPYLHAFDKFPDWDIEPRVKPFQKVLETGKLTSWPAPANRAHGAVINRWIVIDMFTKACTGTPTKNAIAEAVTQLKQIYG
jgi:multiple sugar transport system substrate-binding protein